MLGQSARPTAGLFVPVSLKARTPVPPSRRCTHEPSAMRGAYSMIGRPHTALRVVARWAAWLLVGAVAIVTLAPIELRPVTAAPANWERFAAFATMGALFCLGYPHHRLRIVGLVIG